MRKTRRNNSSLLTWVSRLLLILVILGLVGAGSAWFTWRQMLQPVDSGNQEGVDLVIAPGSSTKAIARQLDQANLIRHPMAFRLFLYREGIGQRLQAGEYQLSQAMTLPEIAYTLTRAIDRQIKVTLLEGWRREEVAEYIAAGFAQIEVDFDQELFLSLPETREGYLFPDTYYFSRQSDENSVAKTIEANFNLKLEPLRSQIQTSQYTLDQILTLASMVERETRVDRPLVAGIMIQRLNNNWPLQIDATFQYAYGYSATEGTWWPSPRASLKELDSPYNTYMYTGLPPAPIANPSLSSIEAVLNAQVNTPYWFYLTDNQGRMHYARTYEEHLANINRYLR